MTQVKPVPQAPTQIASKMRGRTRTLAQKRADLEAQMRRHIDAMGFLDLPDVSDRLKGLRAELARKQGVKTVPQWQIAQDIKIAPRTFQSWETGEVETDPENYGKLAAYYSKKLGRKVTQNWVLYGQDDEPNFGAVLPKGDAGGGGGTATQLDRIEESLGALTVEVAKLAATTAELVAASAPQEKQNKPKPTRRKSAAS